MLGYLSGDASSAFVGMNHFQVWLTLGWAPSRYSDLSLFARHFRDRTTTSPTTSGSPSFAWASPSTVDRARSEIPQQPVL